jgi:hypothetical protein
MWRRIPSPLQPVSNDVNNPADYAPIINMRHAMRQREIGHYPFKLGF